MMEKKSKKKATAAKEYSNGCAICGRRGSKGYFSVPRDSDNTPKRQWQNVIPTEVTTTTRVCFRHWAKEHLQHTNGGKASFKKGKNDVCQIKQHQGQAVK